METVIKITRFLDRIAKYRTTARVRVVPNAAVIPNDCSVKNDTWMTRWISRKFDTVGQNERRGPHETGDGRANEGESHK